MRKILFFIVFVFSVNFSNGQTKKKSTFKPYKIGALFNHATNENFLNDDPDYDYTTNTYKLQAFYHLTNWKGLNIELIAQPQMQFIRHQLLNKWFVTPDQDNVQEKIDEFTQLKSLNLYGVEFGFAFKKRIIKRLDLQATISLGFNYIDTRTERLAKGFTFNENFSLGFSLETFSNSFLYIGANVFGHVSNLDFQKPNDGYNIFGVEVGYAIKI